MAGFINQAPSLHQSIGRLSVVTTEEEPTSPSLKCNVHGVVVTNTRKDIFVPIASQRHIRRVESIFRDRFELLRDCVLRQRDFVVSGHPTEAEDRHVQIGHRS